MKTWISQTRLVAVLGAVISVPTAFAAAADKTDQSNSDATAAAPSTVTVTTSTQSTTATTPAVSATSTAARDTASVKLPYGVDDVLKLSHARISEDVTLNYIQSSGTIYNLSAQDLIYLKNEGVSDKVLNAMQDQRKRAVEPSSAASAVPAVQVYPGPTTAATTAAPVYAPQPIYVQEPAYYDSIVNTEPAYEPASTVYVIPYSSPTYPRYTYASSYPSYGYFGGYSYFGAPPPPRASVALIGGPVHAGSHGFYRFGGGHGLAMSPGHVSSFGAHGHSGGGHSGGGHHR
jgi:hypothetical protein